VIAAQQENRSRSGARPEHYPSPYGDPRYLVEVRRQRARGAAVRSGVDPVAPEDADRRQPDPRVRLQERLKSLGKEGSFKAAHVHVVGAGTMGGDIAAWCALRGLTSRCRTRTPNGSRPAMGPRGEALSPSACAIRAAFATRRTALFPTSPATASRAADVVIEAIFENVEAKRSLFAAVEAKAKAGAILATNTSSIPLEDIATAMRIRRGSSACTSSIPSPKMMLVEIVTGATRAALMRPPRRSSARSTSCRCR
jgi:3-hydroxyacyl-CoA dehydrogenase/enoyl-CoA hydratase/3-hydroxybutyryl-CoA epimerase